MFHFRPYIPKKARMNSFEQRTEEIVKGLSPLVKMSLPPQLLQLLQDMAKALDTLQEKNQ